MDVHCEGRLVSDHQPQCAMGRLGMRHTDAARRLADQWNLHRIADLHGSNGKWFAVALHDGVSDGVLYDSKVAAITHQRHVEKYYAFVRMSMAQMNYCDAEIYLSVQRRLYDSGFRMSDPDTRSGGPDVIKRSTREDMFSLMQLRGTNLIIPGREWQ